MSAQTGSLRGTIKDATTNEALPFANILLVGTPLGAVTNNEGAYEVRNVPAGKYTVRASYIGYKQKEATVEIGEGGTVERNFALSAEAVQGKEVVVTAQAEGQMKAINEQISSLAIKNVVSADRIKELPDANAAESIARLPGVSLIRTGGEGSGVVVRGLSPQYNQITIDGVELPSDLASANNIISTDKTQQDQTVANLGDRGADLSVISSSLLGGIQVIKAVTPDMDATVLGGVVNLDMPKASKSTVSEESGSPIPSVSLTSQGEYNQLKSRSDNYKFVLGAQKRFFDQQFGVLVQVSTEKRNLSANQLNADYTLTNKDNGDLGIPDLNSLDLSDVFRTRKRNGATVVLDYSHENTSIGLLNLVSASDTRAIQRTKSIILTPNDLWYRVNDSHTKLTTLSNLLSIKQDIPIFHVDLKLAHSYSETNDPEDLYFDFWQDDAGLANKIGTLKQAPPQVLDASAIPNDSLADLDVIQTTGISSHQRAYTGFLDLQTQLPAWGFFSSKFKFGGSYQYTTRSNDFAQSNGSQLYSGGGNVVAAMTKAYPWLITHNGRLSFLNFVHDPYTYGNFFKGDYSMPYPMSSDLMWTLLPIAKATSSLEGYQVNKIANSLNNYSGNEVRDAAYAMLTLDLGEDVSIVPGIRYQNFTTNYTAAHGIPSPRGIVTTNATATQSHGYFLPDLHIQYNPLEWFHVHFAYTNTLNYPDFSIITPRYYVSEGFIDYNNWRLKPARSENYDLVLAAVGNEVGLFSITGFTKRITDLVYYTKTYRTTYNDFPELTQFNNQGLREFNTYINSSFPITVRGIETEWQTRFWYLPEPFSNIVFNTNYSHIFSKATYPRDTLDVEYDDAGNLIKDTAISAPYTNRLLNQPNDIVNFSIGYDYGGFSARLSMEYIDNIFKRAAFWLQERVNSAKYTRWDLSVKQKLPWFGIQLYFSLNNISGEDEIDLNPRTGFVSDQQRYGMTGDLGLNVNF
ncbi:MAG: carboxypeptidase-like regulatory domain-containing protein [Bacteroidota bacterium]|nr:carboxypeptidase-like regulatory domain-containing protein [Bacteroidota bacterium]